MERTERIRRIVYDTLGNLNRQLPVGQRLSLAEDTVLCGDGQGLDSLGLVNLIVGVEERLRAELGCEVNLGDEAVAELADSPFRTVASLVRYVEERL
ncbi:MAG: acyl carrier protein [Candidatus Latescibacterota bacterium]